MPYNPHFLSENQTLEIHTLLEKQVVYMDNTLLMANSKQLIPRADLQYTALFFWDLSSTTKKSVLTPCQQMEFLGMTVDSQSIVLKLPGEKIRKIRAKAQHLLAYPSIQAQSLAQAKCNQPNTTVGTTVLPLTPDIRKAIPGNHLPGLPITSQTLPSGSGRPAMVEQHLTSWNQRSLISPASTIVIDLDTSLQG